MSKVSDFDKFGVEAMSKDEHNGLQSSLNEKCLCAGCPSYVEGDENIAFCFPLTGASTAIKQEKGCMCDGCPVYKEYELTHGHYCTRCSQLCQTYKTELGAGHE